MNDYATAHYYDLTDQRHANGRFDFDYTESEIADKERVLREAASEEPDFSLKLSKGLHARFLCDSCKAHCFGAETFRLGEQTYHIGCGGKITECPF